MSVYTDSNGVSWFSPSGIKTYRRCRRLFHEGQQIGSAAASFGTACHSMLETFLGGDDFGTFDNWLVPANARQLVVDFIDVYTFPAPMRRIVIEGRGILDPYAFWKHGRRIARVQLSEDIGIEFIPDLVALSPCGRILKVYDWKSGYVEAGRDDALQGDINAVGLSEIFGLQYVEWEPVYLRWPSTAAVTQYGPVELAEARDRIITECCKILDTKRWTEAVGVQCATCLLGLTGACAKGAAKIAKEAMAA